MTYIYILHDCIALKRPRLMVFTSMKTHKHPMLYISVVMSASEQGQGINKPAACVRDLGPLNITVIRLGPHHMQIKWSYAEMVSHMQIKWSYAEMVSHCASILVTTGYRDGGGGGNLICVQSKVNCCFHFSFSLCKISARFSGPLKFQFSALPATMAHCFTIDGTEWHIDIIANLITI